MILGPKKLLQLVKKIKLVEGLSERELTNPEGAGFDLRLGEVYKISGKAFLGEIHRHTAEITLVKKYEEQKQAEEDAIKEKLDELEKQKDVDPQQMVIQVGMMAEKLERERQATIAKLDREKEKEDNRIENKLTAAVGQVQSRYKLLAVLLPPIPPLIVALIVLITRRAREREGVAKSRLR